MYAQGRIWPVLPLGHAPISYPINGINGITLDVSQKATKAQKYFLTNQRAANLSQKTLQPIRDENTRSSQRWVLNGELSAAEATRKKNLPARLKENSP